MSRKLTRLTSNDAQGTQPQYPGTLLASTRKEMQALLSR